MKAKKKWKDMTPAEKVKERIRIEKAIVQSKASYHNSQIERMHRASQDGREPEPEGCVLDAAVWCLTHRGKPLPTHYVRHSVIESLRDGDSAFFEQLAAALRYFERRDAQVIDGGIRLSYNVKERMVAHWENWKMEKTKVLGRIAELKEWYGITIGKSRYNTLVKELKKARLIG